MAKTRRTYKGGAASTTITGTLASNGTNFVIAAYTGWPYGANPFYVVIEPGTANEEKLLVTRSGATDTTVNVTTRGTDDTTAAQHAAGSVVYPVFTAIDADEANELAATLTSKGDILTHDTSTFARLAVGTNAYVLKADSSATTGLVWGQVATAGIADDAVTSAKIAADAVGSSEIASGAVGASELASDAVTTVKILDANVTAGKLASDSVTTAKIVDANVTTAKLADGAVTNAKLGLTELKIRRAANQTIDSFSWIDFDTEDSDPNGFFAPTDSTITVPAGYAGLYVVACRIVRSSTGSGSSTTMTLETESDQIIQQFGSSGTVGHVFANLYLPESATVRIGITTGGNIDYTARLWMTRILD